jgi:uncharacterized protein YjbI with pentapeptide repeats
VCRDGFKFILFACFEKGSNADQQVFFSISSGCKFGVRFIYQNSNRLEIQTVSRVSRSNALLQNAELQNAELQNVKLQNAELQNVKSQCAQKLENDPIWNKPPAGLSCSPQEFGAPHRG